MNAYARVAERSRGMSNTLRMKSNDYGICNECGVEYEPVWFTEEEYVTSGGIMVRTGRKRRAVDYLICPCCLKKQCVDDSYDGAWH